MAQNIYEIDGNDFSTLEEFYDAISRDVLGTDQWGHNLDAFDDILCWLGSDQPYKLIWKNSNKSKNDLDYKKDINQLRAELQNCHNGGSTYHYINKRLEQLIKDKGPSTFETLVKIIRDSPWVQLELK